MYSCGRQSCFHRDRKFYIFFLTTTACGSNMHQMHIEQMSPKDVKVSVKQLEILSLKRFFPNHDDNDKNWKCSHSKFTFFIDTTSECVFTVMRMYYYDSGRQNFLSICQSVSSHLCVFYLHVCLPIYYLTSFLFGLCTTSTILNICGSYVLPTY